jgi:hypothetical protein
MNGLWILRDGLHRTLCVTNQSPLTTKQELAWGSRNCRIGWSCVWAGHYHHIQLIPIDSWFCIANRNRSDRNSNQFSSIFIDRSRFRAIFGVLQRLKEAWSSKAQNCRAGPYPGHKHHADADAWKSMQMRHQRHHWHHVKANGQTHITHCQCLSLIGSNMLQSPLHDRT